MTSASPWIPVALSADIEAGTSAGTLVNGEERVVWRDDKGATHVWEDRCPHRGMRMSFGFVRGDHIACLEARKHFAWYLRGVAHSSYYKEKISSISTPEDVEAIAKGIRRDLQ